MTPAARHNPRRNRLTPFGEIEATPARGTMFGNRGCLHDESGNLVQPFVNRAWLTCRLDFRGRRRPLAAPGRYTALFFLDEATALAAGHRPCFECRRDALEAFRACWCKAHELRWASAAAVDEKLHAARIDTNGRKVTFTACLSELPAGVMVERSRAPGRAWLLWGGELLPWSHAGYGRPEDFDPDEIVTVLTPKPTVRVLAAGYVPAIVTSLPPTGISHREVGRARSLLLPFLEALAAAYMVPEFRFTASRGSGLQSSPHTRARDHARAREAY